MAERDLSQDAKIMLLMMAANGGSMDEADAKREFIRIIKLSPAEFELWLERAKELAGANALKYWEGRLEP